MVQMVVGEKGKGKTKVLLDMVKKGVEEASGNLVYLDKNNKHMYELHRKVRLINVKDYLIKNCDEFTGFILGICSQDHDLEKLYIDSFMTVASLEMEKENMASVLEKCKSISDTFHVDFVISASVRKSQLPEQFRECVAVEL